MYLHSHTHLHLWSAVKAKSDVFRLRDLVPRVQEPKHEAATQKLIVDLFFGQPSQILEVS